MPDRAIRSKSAEGLTWLAVVRIARGLTQRELAHKAGVSQVQLSRLENGKRRPQAATRSRLARALHVDVEQIFPEGGPGPMDLLTEHLGLRQTRRKAKS